MPIKGLTDNAQLPQLGHIRKGAPKEPGRPGKDLDFFRFEAMSEEDGHLYDIWQEAYGSKPRRIEVELPYPTADENFDAWMEAYTASALQRRCDGEHIVLDRDEEGTIERMKKPCESPRCECQRAGRLFLLLPIFDRLGTVVLTTSSLHDIRNLSGALRRYEAMARRHGADLRGIPFWLERIPRDITTPGKNGRVRRTKYLCRLEPVEDWVAAKREEARQLALQPSQEIMQLMGEGKRQLTDGSAAQGSAAEATSVQEAVEIQREEPIAFAEDGKVLADETEVQELIILCTDEGLFDTRAERLTFTSHLAGYTLESFKDLSHERCTYAHKALTYIADNVPAEQRRNFIRYVLQRMSPEQDLTHPAKVGNWVQSWHNLQAEMAMQEEQDALDFEPK